MNNKVKITLIFLILLLVIPAGAFLWTNRAAILKTSKTEIIASPSAQLNESSPSPSQDTPISSLGGKSLTSKMTR